MLKGGNVMKLNFMDRMMILNSLPEKGSFLTIKAIRVLREVLVPTDEETKEWNIVENLESGQIKWDMNVDTTKEVEISERAFVMISDKLKEMDKADELTANHENIYSLFVD